LACWGLGEASGILYDSVGGYHLDLTQGLTYGATGVIGNCIYLDAASDYARGHDGWLELTTFSISAWLKTSDNTYDKLIYSKTGGSLFRGVDLSISGGYPRFVLYWNGASPNDCGGVIGEERTSTGNFLSDGNWHHILISYNGSNRVIRLFVDGNEDDTGGFGGSTACLPMYNDSSPLYIGNDHDENSGFRGYLDEISVWDNALSAGNARYLYNSGSGRACPAMSPTPSITPSRTPSITPSISLSLTPSITPSISISLSVTPSQSVAYSVSISPSSLQYTNDGYPYGGQMGRTTVTSSASWTAELNSDDGIVDSFTTSGNDQDYLYVIVLDDGGVHSDNMGASITVWCGSASALLLVCRDGTTYTCA